MEKCGSATQLAYEQPCRGPCGWHSVREGEGEGEVSEVMGTRTCRAFWCMVRTSVTNSWEGFYPEDPCFFQRPEAQVTQCMRSSSRFFPRKNSIPSPSSAETWRILCTQDPLSSPDRYTENDNTLRREGARALQS